MLVGRCGELSRFTFLLSTKIKFETYFHHSYLSCMFRQVQRYERAGLGKSGVATRRVGVRLAAFND